ncbi:hypothetical protein [Secundilactobacillus folii]|uniref:Uncharacterized protein n=1 Tax=Secundilactobacillus folii TaxID=2678357 RepID=A0A7X2XT96_9LACO|nr:hypothetical protein [Secundilactobacillus folii]MTV81168.1 hypothetical protein [Secundilactobacillus folii]
MNDEMSFFLSRDPEFTRIVELAQDFYQKHRSPKRVFKIHQLAISELRELAQKAAVSVEVAKSLLYAIDTKSVAKPQMFGHFQCSGHLKNDISPQAIIELGTAEEAIEEGELPAKIRHALDNVELAVFYAFCKLEDQSGVQFDRIILDNEQEQNHAVVEIGAGHYKCFVERMSEMHRINLEQRLLTAVSAGRFWQQVYS